MCSGLRPCGSGHRPLRAGEDGGRPVRHGQRPRLCGANIELIELAVDDSWCRDSGPSFVCHPQHGLAGLSWRFNAWGGKSHHSLDRSLADASSTSWAWTVSAPRCATKAARSMWMAKAR
jgi:hypothetical protein